MVIYFEHQFFVSKSIIPISIILLINKIYHKMIFDRYRRILLFFIIKNQKFKTKSKILQHSKR
ncbi:hypothetical protein BHG07_17455 [Brenneria salicis ATCC 15712 = DSM 30166]|nr:hypothetical protein BHG07_17455 [Brenneria salicis ATCC 15712 = DSM 30166]